MATAADPVALARSLAGTVKAGADEGDRERRLPERVARAMAAAGLYRLSVAAAYGGAEADPITTIKAIEAVSEADGSAGWNLMIGLETAGLASGCVTPDAGGEVWLKQPETIMSGAVNPQGRGKRVEGGWRVSGRWPYASGCHNADWFWGGTIIEDGPVTADGTPRGVQLLIPRADYRIIETWDVAGMRGSGSHDVEVADIFVPAHRMTDIWGERPSVDSMLFRYPVVSRLCYNKVGVATGIARTAIAVFVEMAGAKVPYTAQQLLRERAHAQLAVAEAEALLEAGRAFVFAAVGQMWDEVAAGRAPSKELRIRQRLASSFAVDSCVKAVELLYRSSGASPNFRDHPLERLFRDVHVVRAHTTVTPAIFETAGRALLGLPVAPGSF
jgi:indole-3-acetate monooxygenase